MNSTCLLSLVTFNEATAQEKCDIRLKTENYILSSELGVKYHEINVVKPDNNSRLQKSNK